MDTTMLLCDFAESVNGKLYIVGGGWTRLRHGNPLDCAVALYVAVPWNQANQQHRLRVELLDEDGELVTDAADTEVVIEGEFEVGRPPGSKAGEPIGQTLGFRFRGVVLEAGGYKFSCKINGTEVAATPFRVDRK